eukprot:Opistho-1_new@35709
MSWTSGTARGSGWVARRRSESSTFATASHAPRNPLRTQVSKSEDEKEALFQIQMESRRWTVMPIDVEQWAYSAKKAAAAEFRLESFCEVGWEVHALVDLKAGVAYAMKFEFKRDGAHVIDYVRIPE